MRESLPVLAYVATKTGGHVRPRRDRIVPRKFGKVAKLLWPQNTAAHIAAIGQVDIRTGKRWMRGEGEPAAAVLLACIEEMLREQR